VGAPDAMLTWWQIEAIEAMAPWRSAHAANESVIRALRLLPARTFYRPLAGTAATVAVEAKGVP